MKELVSSRALEVVAILPIALTLIVLEAFRAIPNNPVRFVRIRRVLVVLAVLLFGFLGAVVAARFHYLKT